MLAGLLKKVNNISDGKARIPLSSSVVANFDGQAWVRSKSG